MTDRLTRWEGADENGPRAVLAKREGSWLTNMDEAMRKLARYEDEQEIQVNIFDKEEIYPNCTVQVLTNSVTGEVSVGWWENEEEGHL